MNRIVLDAGHGFFTKGKRCLETLDPNQTREWYLNNKVCNYLQDMLRDYRDVQVLRVDDITGDTDVKLATRVMLANNFNADVYISVHHNAGINGGSGGGTVVYYANTKPQRKYQAQHLYNYITKETGLIGNRAQAVIYRNFYVISKTKAPAFLIENGFMDSSNDVPVILTDKHANRTAIGIFNWLVDCMHLL